MTQADRGCEYIQCSLRSIAFIHVTHFFETKNRRSDLRSASPGYNPEKLALSLALGFCIGTFPLIGTTTLICTLVAVPFRLNLPAIQIANYAVYPLQLLLLVPFRQAGALGFHADPLPLKTGEIKAMFAEGWWDSIKMLWQWLLGAMAAWLIIWVPATGIFYILIKPVLKRLNSRSQNAVQFRIPKSR
jgi:uncharacterized protein (DUF2062 family)